MSLNTASLFAAGSVKYLGSLYYICRLPVVSKRPMIQPFIKDIVAPKTSFGIDGETSIYPIANPAFIPPSVYLDIDTTEIIGRGLEEVQITLQGHPASLLPIAQLRKLLP